MNERLRELMLKADYPAPELAGRAQKLAELIVADCIKIVEGYCETSPEIYGLPLEILEHFDMELPDA